MSDLKNKIEKLRKLKNGVGVQNLLNAAYKIIENPILMHDTEYKLTAYTKVELDDAVWNDIVKNGKFSMEMQQFFVDEGFVEDVANAKNVAVLKSKRWKYDRTAGKIFNKDNVFVSNLIIVVCNRPLEENDIIINEIICKLITKEISKDEFYLEYGQSYQELLINNLIDRKYDKKLHVAHVEILYKSLDSGLYIAVLDTSKYSNEDAIHFVNILKQKKPAYKYSVYSKYIVIVISTNDNNLNIESELKEFAEFFKQNNIYVGLSSRFENLFELQKYYNEAVSALNAGVSKQKNKQRIFIYNKADRSI